MPCGVAFPWSINSTRSGQLSLDQVLDLLDQILLELSQIASLVCQPLDNLIYLVPKPIFAVPEIRLRDLVLVERSLLLAIHHTF